MAAGTAGRPFARSEQRARIAGGGPLNPARLLIPALRWSPGGGSGSDWTDIERAIELGVGGFILFGGEAASVCQLVGEIRARAGRPLLIGSDLERGAGQQFAGGTPLPPAAALASLGEVEVARRAGELTAREARAIGVDWIFAPVADLDVEPRNPIVGTRAWGPEPAAVGRMVAAWVQGCREGGALSCVKHFPGHGRTLGDSHLSLPSVGADGETLALTDLVPFQAAVHAGADSVMIGHVAYPGLDLVNRPATLSPPILGPLLRSRLGFRGIAVTDAIDMAGFAGGADAGERAVEAVGAGCDVLLYPADLQGVAGALAAATGDGRLDPSRLAEAIGRMDAAVGAVGSAARGGWGGEEDAEWALEVAVRTISVARGDPRLPGWRISLIEVDDDVGGPHPPPPRDAFRRALDASGLEIGADARPLLVVYADVRGWKGRAGLSNRAREQVERACAAHPEITAVIFGHPRLAAEVPTARNVLVAWGGEPLMQRAAGDWLSSAQR